jgi:hypothetical protein
MCSSFAFNMPVMALDWSDVINVKWPNDQELSHGGTATPANQKPL